MLRVVSPSVRANWTNDRTAFDFALLLGEPSRPRVVIGVATNYHEHAIMEKRPADHRLARYREIAERAGCFVDSWEDKILGTQFQQLWRDHLLLLSMLQRTDQWSGGRYLLVHPAGNPAFREVGERYRDVLTDARAFEVMTIEDLLETDTLHRPAIAAEFRQRYLW